MDVREALGVQGLGREELALGAEGRVLDPGAVGAEASAVGQEAIARHPGHRRALEGG